MSYQVHGQYIIVITVSNPGPYHLSPAYNTQAQFTLRSFVNCINSSNRQIIALSAQLETVYHGLHNLHMITQVCVITAGFHGLETAVDQPD